MFETVAIVPCMKESKFEHLFEKMGVDGGMGRVQRKLCIRLKQEDTIICWFDDFKTRWFVW